MKNGMNMEDRVMMTELEAEQAFKDMDDKQFAKLMSKSLKRYMNENSSLQDKLIDTINKIEYLIKKLIRRIKKTSPDLIKFKPVETY